MNIDNKSISTEDIVISSISESMILDLRSQISQIDHTNLFNITKELVYSAEKLEKLNGPEKKEIVLKALHLAQNEIQNNHIKSAVEFLLDGSIPNGIDTIVSIINHEQNIINTSTINPDVKKLKFRLCCFISESN